MAPTPEFVKNKSNPVGYVQSSVRDFAVESRRLIQKCKKPDGKGDLPFVVHRKFLSIRFNASVARVLSVCLDPSCLSFRITAYDVCLWSRVLHYGLPRLHYRPYLYTD